MSNLLAFGITGFWIPFVKTWKIIKVFKRLVGHKISFIKQARFIWSAAGRGRFIFGRERKEID